MLLLLFQLRDEMYALDSSQIIEIIPMVILKKLHQTPDYVAGLFNYRGKIIPVIDLSHLIQGNPCSHCLSTRIILVKYPSQTNQTHYLGLMAERVTDTLNKSESEFVAPEFSSEKNTYLGEMIIEKNQMIQRIRIENLFPDSSPIWLLPGNKS